jgi:hypothetical protein
MVRYKKAEVVAVRMGVPMQPGMAVGPAEVRRKYTLWVLVLLIIVCWPAAIIYYFTRDKGTFQEVSPYSMPVSSPTMPPMASQPPMAPSPAAAGPACPRCGRPTTWIPEYSRYYCSTDQQYV